MLGMIYALVELLWCLWRLSDVSTSFSANILVIGLKEMLLAMEEVLCLHESRNPNESILDAWPSYNSLGQALFIKHQKVMNL